MPTPFIRCESYAEGYAELIIDRPAARNALCRSLTDEMAEQLARLADAWRPYGIRVYLSARFSAPRDIGGLNTADPLDPAVRAWWQAKADEIYTAIPDFGGFLVKANSEGQPGPQDYGRTHADGANMLAASLGDRLQHVHRGGQRQTIGDHKKQMPRSMVAEMVARSP